MILEEATHEAFGYYLKDLKRKSHKPIIAACDKCGKVRKIRKGAYCSLCHSCAGKGKNTGKNRTLDQNAARGIASKGKNNPNWKPKVKCICLQCRKEFELHEWEITN